MYAKFTKIFRKTAGRKRDIKYILVCFYIALFLQGKNHNNMKLTEVSGRPSRHFSWF